MQSNVARTLKALEKQNPVTIPARVIPLRPSAREQKKGAARRTFSNERLEEAVGVGFIIVTFFLTGWFYYSLYRALQN